MNRMWLDIKVGRKIYHGCFSSFEYRDKNLWLYVFGENSDCGYIPNGKVIRASVTERSFIPSDTVSIIIAWNK